MMALNIMHACTHTNDLTDAASQDILALHRTLITMAPESQLGWGSVY